MELKQAIIKLESLKEEYRFNMNCAKMRIKMGDNLTANYYTEEALKFHLEITELEKTELK